MEADGKQPGAKRKIAVLGGGVSSMTAVLSLTSEPDWQSKYEITVYQLGWRLGGKGASGRNGKVVRVDGKGTIEGHARIQEHGLHIWLGFYDNAFRLIRQVYEENAPNLPPEAPLRLWSDAFKKHNFVCVEENPGEPTWRNWWFNFPEDERVPGTPGPACTLWDYAKLLLKGLLQYWHQSTYAGEPIHVSERQKIHAILYTFRASLEHLWEDASALEFAFGTELVETAQRFAERLHPDAQQHAREEHKTLLGIVNAFHDWLHKRFNERNGTPTDDVSWSDQTRRDFIVLDLGLAILRGLLADGVLLHPQQFDVLEDDFQDWLSRHGACETSCRVDQSAVMRGLYDLVFAYLDGDATQPSFATGPALRSLFDMTLRYKGSIFWKMQAGMGDTIFSPMYMVLKQRGVRFEFFHAVENLGLSADKRSVATIRVGRQVHLKDPAQEYDPLVWVKDVPCWPADPDFGQIVEGDQLQAGGSNLESFWTPWKSVETLTLQAGVHFDEVVLGISIGALPYLCPELIQAAPLTWGCMVEKVKTVRTMGFQFWVNQDLAELGWTQNGPVMDAYVEPLNTWADMSQLLVRENWTHRETPPKSCAYFCGQMTENVPPEQADAYVRQTAAAFANGPLRRLWPGLHDEPPQQFLSHAPADSPQAALDSQYYRANVDPTERYVMSVAGATGARLRADQSGFDRLVLTGDWISNGFNAGCVESAVMSGLQAANVIAGRPLAYGISALRETFGQEPIARSAVASK